MSEAIPVSGLAIISAREIEVGLAKLRADCEAIVVCDQGSYIEALDLVKDGRNWIKDVGAKLDPGIDSAKRHYEFLRAEKSKYVEPAKAIVAIAEVKAENWRAEEKRKAEADARRKQEEVARENQRRAEEQRREDERLAKERKTQRIQDINTLLRQGEIGKRESARLLKEAGATAEAAIQDAAARAEELKNAPPPEVKVEAAIPKVAGIKGRRNFYAEFRDGDALVRAFLAGDAERRAFLRQFIAVDDQALGKYARETKDSKKVAATVPGAHAWDKESI